MVFNFFIYTFSFLLPPAAASVISKPSRVPVSSMGGSVTVGVSEAQRQGSGARFVGNVTPGDPPYDPVPLSPPKPPGMLPPLSHSLTPFLPFTLLNQPPLSVRLSTHIHSVYLLHLPTFLPTYCTYAYQPACLNAYLYSLYIIPCNLHTCLPASL